MDELSANLRCAAALCGVAFALAAWGGRGGLYAAVSGNIAVATTDGRIVLIDTTGRRVAVLTHKPTAATFDRDPAWSPDGARIAFARSSDGFRSSYIYVMRADGRGGRRISTGRYDESPAWSPDGRWIAYTSSTGLRIVHPDGSDSRAVPGTGIQEQDCTESYASMPSWAPGERVSFSFHPENPPDWPKACKQHSAHCGWVLTTLLNGGDRRPIVHGRDAHWSPDGKTIVYTLPNGGVATIAATGGKPRVLGRGYLADWSANGRQIVFARLGQTAAGDSIWLMGADGANRRPVMRGASNPAWRPS